MDLQRDTLFIRETKFSKNRIVPFGPNLATRLRRYVEEHHGEKPEAERPLFSWLSAGIREDPLTVEGSVRSRFRLHSAVDA